ncbi:FecR family protein [Pseudomonas sp. NPDC089401]|uniref:FecR family protein n=1 Tax=Pseudomonas sp. NPDC089401 TaxID=3364462 RepID=UPI003800D02B
MRDPSISDLHDAAIRRQAQAWVVLLTSGEAGADDVAAARAWCGAAPAHQAAFVEARRVWMLSGQVPVPTRRSPLRRYLAAACAAVLVLGVGATGMRHFAWDADYRTGAGERRSVTLADGSRIVLDADSAVDVSLFPAERRITLRRGDAFFQVQHDPDRPFVVQAGTVSATALGTEYGVSRESTRVDVIVRTGRVRVQAMGRHVDVPAGQRVSVDGQGVGQVLSVDADGLLAWHGGRLVFNQTPLPVVVAQLQRYRPGLIYIADDQLRSIKVSGTFQLDRIDAALSTLEQTFPLRVTRYTDHLLVFTARQ